MNLKAKLMKLFRENVNISKKISVALLSFMIMLSLLAPVVKANEASNSNAETPKTNFVDEHGDGLEIGPEIIGQPVGVAVKAPTVNPVLYDATTISGGNLAKAKVDKKLVIATVHVTLKGEDGTVKAELSVTPKSGTKWKVDLTGGVKVAKGDKVSVYQQIGEDKSPEVTANAQPSKASTVNLTMPTGKIWIEQTSSNIVNEDEQAEAVRMFNDANTEIAGDIKSVKFSIDGIAHAYYEVTYTDESTSGKVEAKNLQIKQVTETSRGATLGSITIVDDVIKGKLAGEGPFDGIKVQLILNVKKEKSGDFCTDKGCKIDKDSSNPVDVTLQADGSFSYTLKERESLTLDQIVGVSVKEPHKFVSCSTTTVKPVTPGKTEVRDPKKLTDADKGKIVEAIKTAYTTKDGQSKLPNGTGDWDGVPAVIQFDDSGNAKIFSGNDVAGTWDPNNDYKFVPETNDDGSVKLKEGAEPTATIPAKDLVKNIAPKSPAIKVDTDTGKVTITPPAYKDPGDDTDLLSYTITYTDDSGAEKTVTATRDLQTNKWSGPGVNEESGVITLSVEKIELAGTIKATAKDNGGLEGDTDKLDSDPATKTLETATVSYDCNGGTGDMDSKTLNKGSKYKILSNAFTAPANQKFKAWKIGDTEYAAGDEITVKADTSIKAVWQKSHSVKYNWGTDAPGTATLPTDSKNYYKGDSYKVDDKYTNGTTVEGEQDGKKGTWTFSGWSDPNNGTMGEQEVTITGSWTFKEKSVIPPAPDNQKDPTNPTDSTKPTNRGGNVGKAPKTGDNRNLAFWTSLLALVGMGVAGATSYGRKKRQK